MGRVEFLSVLDESLKCLPDKERREAVEFYYSYFDDAMESGKTQEEIVEELGPPEKIASKIIAQYNFRAKSEASHQAFAQASGGKDPFKVVKGVMLAIAAVFIGLPGAVIIGIPALCVLFGLLIAMVCIIFALAVVVIVVPIVCVAVAVALFAAVPIAGASAVGWAFLLIGAGLLVGTLIFVLAYWIIRGVIALSTRIIEGVGGLMRRRAVSK